MTVENKKTIVGFVKKHPIIANFIAICLTFIVLCLLTMLALNIFTEHGRYKTVPDVKRMPIDEAISRIENAGFKWEITDSTYNDSYPLGSVIEQDPKPNSQAKSLRTVYLSVNASSPRMLSVPVLNDLSLRQGESMLQGLGFKNISIVYMPSPYKDLILKVAVSGQEVISATKATKTASIVIYVGNGEEEILGDSITNLDESEQDDAAITDTDVSEELF